MRCDFLQLKTLFFSLRNASPPIFFFCEIIINTRGTTIYTAGFEKDLTIPMTLSCIADYTEEKTSTSRLYIDIDIEINMDTFDMIEFEELSPIDASQDECDWSPPPPQAYRQRKCALDTIDTAGVFLQQQQVSNHIKNYKAAMGREIVKEEPGQWMCGHDTLRECAAKVAEFLRQPIVSE